MMANSVSNNNVFIAELLDGVTDQQFDSVLKISGIGIDSRQIDRGDLFVALKGSQHDGSIFIRDAINNGAVCVLHESALDELTVQEAAAKDVPLIKISNLNACLGMLAKRFYGDPSGKIKLIGVTGTDGKTSVCNFIAQVLDLLNQKCGVFGTLGNGVYDNLEPSLNTTSDTITLQKMMFKFPDTVRYAAMEVSSHGLEQKRVSNLTFETAILTNLGRDHLDFHLSQEAYKYAKQKLFLMQKLKHAVVNIDDNFGKELLSVVDSSVEAIAYGIQADKTNLGLSWVIGKDLEILDNGFTLIVQTPGKQRKISCNLLGDFNAYNILAVIAAVQSLGFAFDEIVDAIGELRSVPGRMELFRSEKFPNVVVDYAHTPQALESVLKVIRQHTQGSIWCVFGCGGDRDKGKRPLMGKAAIDVADEIIVTDDNPRTEDADIITNQILQGINDSVKASVIHDRKEAISKAVASASVDDIVLVAGKGHEEYQIIGNERKPFSDRKVVSELLGETL